MVRKLLPRPPMKTRLAALLLAAAFPADLPAAPGGVLSVRQKIVDGLPSDTPVFGAFGSACVPLGDLDGDGHPDLAVGQARSRSVHILFLAADGSVDRFLRLREGENGLPAGTAPSGSLFGSSLANLGDLDGDGIPDLAVGASNEAGGGALHILFLKADGTVKAHTRIADGAGGLPAGTLDEGDFFEDFFGSSCAALGDLDGDGVPELAVGASQDEDLVGAVHVLFLRRDGTVKSSGKIADGSGGPVPRFGTSCAALGDLDGDGVPELAVGATGDDTGGGSNRGAVNVLFLNANGTVKAMAKIADGVGGLPGGTLANGDFFGSSAALLGKSAGNGLPLLVVGAEGDRTGGDFFSGAVYLLELGDPPLTVTTLADKLEPFPSNPLSLREAIRDAKATGEFRTIRFAPPLGGGAVDLGGTLVVEDQSLRITGEGLPDGLALSGQGAARVLSLVDATLALDSVTVRDGATDTGGGAGIRVDGGSRLVLGRAVVANCIDASATGGGVFNQGSLSVVDCAFLGNRSTVGGAILNSGPGATLSVLNTTFSGNEATVVGGAILSASPSTIRHATFVGNTADDGGAIASFGTCALSASLFAGNLAAANPDFNAVVTDGGGNAFVALPQLMPLGDYGGRTPTRPLKPDSTAKGTVAFAPLPLFDQRGAGFPRTRGSGRDPGAVEAMENIDFQPDNRIGLKKGKQIGNNRYNAGGAGQTVALKLVKTRKAKTFFTVENDGIVTDTIRVKSDKPNARTLKGKVFRTTGGRKNVSAQVFRAGLVLDGLAPNAGVAFQGEWSRKSATRKAKQTVKIRSTSLTAPKGDTAGTKVSSK